MLSLPGSDAQPMHQDGPHLNADEYDKQQEKQRLEGASGSGDGKSKAAGGSSEATKKRKSQGGGGAGKEARHLPPYAVNVFVPLVDISVENGGTEFWLGTHRLGAHAPSSGGSSGSLLRVTLLPVLAC